MLRQVLGRKLSQYFMIQRTDSWAVTVVCDADRLERPLEKLPTLVNIGPQRCREMCEEILDD